MKATKDTILDAKASGKTRMRRILDRETDKRAREWVKQNLDRKMLDNLFALVDAELIEPTQSFYRNVLSRDGFTHRMWTVLVYPDGEGGWVAFESNDGGGGMETFRTKHEAIERALWFVRERNAELHVTNKIPLTDAEWQGLHDF